MSRDTPSTPSDKVIVVMGPVGVGKTTFIDSATAQQFQGVDLGLQSRADLIVTREPVSRNGQRYVFVEIPGFDGEDSSDVEVLSMIAEYMVKARKEKYNLESILYLHRISDNRLAGPPLRNLELFSAICGTKAMPRMVLVTTMWNHVIKEVGEERERQLKTSLWQGMVNQGCSVKQFDGTNDRAWEIIESSRSSTSTAPFDVLISEELLDQHKDLKETQAGATLHKHLEQLVKDQNEVNRRLKALDGDWSNRLGTGEERKQMGVLGDTTVQTTEHMQMPKPLSATGVLDDRSKGVKETEVEAILNQQPRRMTRGQGQISGGLSVADNQSPAYNSSPTAESNAADQLIILMGQTGAGRSTFINHAAGQEVTPVGHGQESCTNAIVTSKPIYWKGQRYIFIDTPGFGHTEKSDTEIIAILVEEMTKARNRMHNIRAILYLYRILDPPMARSQLNSLELFKDLVGMSMMSRVALVTTMWGQASREYGKKQEKLLEEGPWKQMIDTGCSVQKFKDSQADAWRIIESIASTPTPSNGDTIGAYISVLNLAEQSAVWATHERQLNKLIEDQKEGEKRLQALANRLGNQRDKRRSTNKMEQLEANIMEKIHVLKLPWTKRIARWFCCSS